MKVIIVGGGKVGTYLASLLLANGQDVTLIEDNDKYYNKAMKELPENILCNGNASDPAVLEKVGIASADVLAAVSDADEKNLVVSTLAKMEFGVSKVIARVNNPKNAWLYNSGMGVDVQVNQADIMAHLVVEEMDLENMFTLMKLNRGEYSIVQMSVRQTSHAANQILKDLPIPKNAVLISITREGSVVIPKGDTQVLVGDEILILTDEDSRKELQKILG
jgi:trk system potassium uptake protein TrkA